MLKRDNAGKLLSQCLCAGYSPFVPLCLHSLPLFPTPIHSGPFLPCSVSWGGEGKVLLCGLHHLDFFAFWLSTEFGQQETSAGDKRWEEREVVVFLPVSLLIWWSFAPMGLLQPHLQLQPLWLGPSLWFKVSLTPLLPLSLGCYLWAPHHPFWFPHTCVSNQFLKFFSRFQ